jgi:hypothetical protein
LEILDGFRLEEFNSVRSIEVSESASAPDVELLVVGQSSVETACAHLDYLGEVDIFEQNWICLIREFLADSYFSVFV